MPDWALLVTQLLITAAAVFLVLWGFWALVVRPYLDRKVAELIAASEEIEPRVARGVKAGVAETLRELPESAWDGTVKESTRQFLKFGSGLFENGLSSFLGSAADLERKRQQGRSTASPAPETPPKQSTEN
jgi:flagellar biosynthesis/type III secretory pathway M-ring protein FliF/YscJ